MGERFVRAGLLTEEQVQMVLAHQANTRLRFGQAAVQLGLASEDAVRAVLAEQYHYAPAAPGLNPDITLPIATEPFGAEAEAIRQLCAEVSASMDALRRIAIVGPGDGVGRSYLAASLAVAFSQTGRQTLLVNANLRPGGQGDLLGAAGAYGLSSILAGRVEIGEYRAVDGYPSLAVLDAGPLPPNPTELLRQPALRNILDVYAERFEIFIIDTAESNETADALSVARQADACLLVARKDITRLSALERTARQLQASGLRVLGTVYNTASPPSKRRQRKRALMAGSPG
ncbi:polysaccharide biosynthesis tyrosine autokinase [Pigmentiphaga humi]|nr:polysaccharide biosynthesis tyrosine autokinase [Pigmentiphaga humi]